MRTMDMIGHKYHRLIVLGVVGKDKQHCAMVEALCDCGRTTITRANGIIYGNTKSCGCLNKERVKQISTKHGMYLTKTYKAWRNMLSRCYNPHSSKFYLYGGKGITVCDQWHNFENFLADMGEAPTGRSLERKDGQKGYEKSNCIWATIKEQNRNTSRNRYLTYKGETKTVAEWAEVTGKNVLTLRARLNRNWDVERIIETPTYKGEPHGSTVSKIA